MVKIRLTRLGRHKQPFYRVVVVDSRSPRDGAYIELLGTLEPFSGKIALNKEAILKWLNMGAQPSDTALSMLRKEGIWKEFKDSKDQSKKVKASAPKKTGTKLKSTIKIDSKTKIVKKSTKKDK